MGVYTTTFLEVFMPIITQYIFPPIPDRSHDWVAYREGDEEGPIGYGKTEDEAINDLSDYEE